MTNIKKAQTIAATTAAFLVIFPCLFILGKGLVDSDARARWREDAAKRRKQYIHGNSVHLYAKNYHNGLRHNPTLRSDKDFDNDGTNDPYQVCGDGTIIARLSSKNKERKRLMNPSDYWFDIGQQNKK